MADLFQKTGSVKFEGIALDAQEAQLRPGHAVQGRAVDIRNLFVSITGLEEGPIAMLAQIDGKPVRVFQGEYECGFDVQIKPKQPYPFYFPAAYRTVGLHVVEFFTGAAQQDGSVRILHQSGRFAVIITEGEES